MSRPKSNASRSSKIIKMIDLELIVEGCDVAWRDFVKRTGCSHEVYGIIIIVVDVLLFFVVDKPARRNHSRRRVPDVLTIQENDSSSSVSTSSSAREKKKTMNVPVNLKIIMHDLVILDDHLETLNSTTSIIEMNISIEKYINVVCLIYFYILPKCFN